MSHNREALYSNCQNLETAEQEAPKMANFSRANQVVGRVALSLGLTAGLVCTSFAPEIDSPSPAFSATDTYPDRNAPCMSEGPNLGKVEGDGYWCENYDWGYEFSANSSRGYGYRNCTDWAAWRAEEITGISVPSGWGHAKNWDDAARIAGYAVDTTPEQGDIAVWNNGFYGHVEVVEHVNGNGSVNTSGYNKGRDGEFGTQSGTRADVYIDLNGAGNSVASQERPVSDNNIPWHFTTLEGDTNSLSGYDADTGQTPTALEFNDKLYVFSYDKSGGNLRLASSADGTGWSFTTLEGDSGSLSKYDANVGQVPAAVVYNNTLHAYYYAVDGGNLRHAWSPDGVNWTFETLDGAGGGKGRRNANIGQTPAVEVYNNTMQVFYRDADNKVLRHAWTSPSQGWRFEDLEGMSGSVSHYAADVGHDPDAEVWNNQLHLYYYDKTKENLRHAWTGNGQGWKFENLDGDKGSICGQDAKTGKNPSVTAHGDTMHLLYYNESGGDLRHAWTGKTEGWRCETVEGDTAAALGYDSVVGSMPTITSIGGNLQAFAYQPEWGTLRHYWWDGKGTHSENFDGLGGLPSGRQNAWTGLDPAIVPFNDKIYAFYYGNGNGDLRLAISK